MKYFCENLKDMKPLDAVFSTINKLRGSFALGIMFKDFQDVDFFYVNSYQLDYSFIDRYEKPFDTNSSITSHP